ncbi:MAG: metallophosphoesterase [Clostridiales bacterium]|nr:metallophosphoesterase [Clostridiales bacterium]
MLTAIVGCNYGSPDSSSNKQEYSKDLWEEYMLQADYVDNFKIMQLADVQARTAEECNDAFTDIQKLVEKEKPNLIVLTGDNIEVPQSEDVLTALISNMESLNTAWAPVFGNHDAEGVLTKDFMAEKFIASEHCLFYKGEQDVDGVGNFVINLTTESNKIIYSLFLIDSNMYSNGGYDSIHANQIEWYERAVNRLTEINKNKVVPSLTFFHIPLHEFNDAKASYERGESHGSFATFNEQMCPGVENTGFFNVAKELNSTKAIFCGHDHINNCDIEYLGIHLVYGLKSSKCSYYDRSLLGATMITLTSDAMEIRNSFFE